MAVRRVAGDEQASRAKPVGDGNAQVPEADVIEAALEFEARGLVQQRADPSSLRAVPPTGAWKNQPSCSSIRPKNRQ